MKCLYCSGGSNNKVAATGSAAEGNLKAPYKPTVIVTIDPPQDSWGGVEDGGGVGAGGEEGAGLRREPPAVTEKATRSLTELFGTPLGAEEGEDSSDELFHDLNEMDLAEEDESEPAPPTKICLLSK